MFTIRAALIVAAFFCALPSQAQNFDMPEVIYPEVERQGATIDSFVPKGWRLEMSRKGDLNKDGMPDHVLVLRCNDPENIVNNDGFGPNDFDTNPRILAVVFARKEGGYNRVLANQTLIPRNDNPSMEDPLDSIAASGIEIKNGALHVQLGIFYSAGSWTMGSKDFTFRWQDGDFRLIGFDENTVQRNSGETTGTSVNYLTGRMKVTTGSIEDDAEKAIWRKIRVKPLLTLDGVGDGLEFGAQDD
jgi:hypothetical protein